MNWPEEMRRARRSALVDTWSTGNRTTGIGLGDSAFLVMQGAERGLVASGTFMSEVYPQQHWNGSAEMANFADVRWEVLVALEHRAPTEILKVEVPGVSWRHLYRSGVRVDDQTEPALLRHWEQHLASLPAHAVARTP